MPFTTVYKPECPRQPEIVSTSGSHVHPGTSQTARFKPFTNHIVSHTQLSPAPGAARPATRRLKPFVNERVLASRPPISITHVRHAVLMHSGRGDPQLTAACTPITPPAGRTMPHVAEIARGVRTSLSRVNTSLKPGVLAPSRFKRFTNERVRGGPPRRKAGSRPSRLKPFANESAWEPASVRLRADRRDRVVVVLARAALELPRSAGGPSRSPPAACRTWSPAAPAAHARSPPDRLSTL